MDNVIVQEKAFAFCRYSMTVLVWLAFGLLIAGFRVPSAVVPAAVCLIMAASAALTVRRAPMILLWTHTLGRAVASEEVVLNVRAMRFSHVLASILALIATVWVFDQRPGAWLFVLLFALLKTFSAVGFCPAYKLYGCVAGGG